MGSSLEEDARVRQQELVELFRTSLNSRADGENFLFTPFWDSKQERITTFACELAGWKSEPPLVDSAGMGIAAASGHCRLDIMALASATRGVHHLLSRGEMAAISVTVHVSTLAWSKSRNGYFDVLGRIDPKIRALLAPRMIGFDAGSNLTAISQWATALRRFVPWTFVHLPHLNFEFWRVGLLGVRGIGLSVKASQATPNGLKLLAGEAEKLCRICGSQRAIAYADNVTSVEELAVLKGCGVRGIAGPVIGPAEDLPAGTKALAFAAPVSSQSAVA